MRHDLLVAAQRAGKATVDGKPRGLRDQPTGRAGGDEIVFGQNRNVRSAELEHQFLAGIVRKNRNCHKNRSFKLRKSQAIAAMARLGNVVRPETSMG
jgi:hypothetical protein